MIDNVRLKLPRNVGRDIPARLENYRRSDMSTGTGNIGAMGVSHNLDGVTVRGSIAKFLNGENVSPLSRATVRAAVEKLETELGVNLSGAVVHSVEFGTSVILKEKPAEYLRLFGDPPVYGKHEYSKGGVLETVLYGTPTGAYQFTAYDKGREAADRGQKVPELFRGRNVMRLEWRVQRRRGILARFGHDLTAYDLFDHDTYAKLRRFFLDAYEAIPKMGRTVYVDISKHVTPARLEELKAEAWRQSDTGGYNAFMQRLVMSGALSVKNLERIRAKDRQLDRDFSRSDTNHLIAELDGHVRTAAMYGA